MSEVEWAVQVRCGPAAGLWFAGEALFLKSMLIVNVFKNWLTWGRGISVVNHLPVICETLGLTLVPFPQMHKRKGF